MELSELARIVFQTELETMQLNLTGYAAEMDPTHIHDLRVAERRTRAALSEFKELLPEQSLEQFREQFRWLHQITNQVRDLDVGISHFPSYRRKVSPFRRGYLQPALNLLESRRRDAQRQLGEILRSGQVDELLHTWSSKLGAGMIQEVQAGRISAAEYGRGRICMRYRSLRDKALLLTPQSPSRLYHDLRIDIKKLRYQIEFYNLALKQKRISRLLKRLKRFQDHLGGLQDAVVQIEHIQHLAEELHRRGAGLDVQAALDQLLASYQKKISSSRRESFRQVIWLASDKTARAFQRCFNCPSVPVEIDHL
jgi:CHAD domain-containing protein